MKKIEITSPVGSYESLSAAIRGGAGSIYFGVGKLNMRSRSSANFSIDDLKKIARICDKSKIKCYLVLNTIIYDEEIEEMRKICDAAMDSGISAVVAADISAIKYAHKIGLEVHISVQANISNLEAVKFYAKFADTMILARELNLMQIEYIIKEIRKQKITGPGGELIKIELFAHGALCVAVSGKCYMSLNTYNTSANRGECFQNCRRSYKVIDEQTGEEMRISNKFVMSPKDLCTLPVLKEILDSGVDILKIEGRGRSADYVYTVTKTYRTAVDCWNKDTITASKIKKWLKNLNSVFNRGFWHGGYYLGEKMGEWCGTEGNISPVEKYHCGEISNYFNRIKVAELTLSASSIQIEDEILITGPTTGALKTKINELRLDRKPVRKAEKGQIVSLPVPGKVRKNDSVYVLKHRIFGRT